MPFMSAMLFLSLSLSLSNALSFGFYSGDGLLISEKF